MDWSKQSISGTVDENWGRLKSFLQRLNALDASATKIVEGQNSEGKTITTVIYPVRVAGYAEPRLGDLE